MFSIQPTHQPKFTEALFVLLAVLAVISTWMIAFQTVPHIPIILSIFFLVFYGLFRKLSYKQLEDGLIEGAKGGLAAVLLFFLIGLLVSSWMISGTIPSLMFYGFSFISPGYFYAAAFILTALCGLFIGSSLTTAATVGVVFISMAGAFELNTAIAAGAIVSGAFFGDKMSPLSDTTNLASSIVKVDLFTHIRNMSWTTIPAFIVTLFAFLLLTPTQAAVSLNELAALKEGLLATDLVHWYSLLPVILLIALVLSKVPALLTLIFTITASVVVSYFHHTLSAGQLSSVLFGGYVSETGTEAVDSLLTRGGLNSMMFTISLVLLALSLGGLLFKLGIVPSILNKTAEQLNSARRLILTTVCTAIGINIVIGEQYLSILLTGEAYQSAYEKAGVPLKNLSRALEDGGTVINPLVPWSVCGIFLSGVLGVPTLSYLPFTFFCLLCPVFAVLFGITGWTISKKGQKNALQ